MFELNGYIRAALALVLMAVVGSTGCSMALELDDSQQSHTEQAREHLTNHEVDDAQALYAEALVADPTHGEAAAGKALADLLLLAEASELDPLWVEYFGAEESFDANRVLYAEGGVFYWMSKGVPWRDNGDYAGIGSLIGDRLPWPAERLSSLYDFTRGVDRHVGDGIESTVALADVLAQVERELRIALDDEQFETFVLPGEVFHAGDADIALGRVELSALSAGIAFLRGLIYFNAAYAHGWTPEDAVVAAEGDQQRQIDHAVAYLDTRFYRAIDSPARLLDARDAFASAIKSLRESVHSGGDTASKTAIDWQSLSSAERRQFLALLTGLQESLYGRTSIPYTQPETTMDLSVFFEEGRALPARDEAGALLYWLEPMTPEDDLADAAFPGWKFNDQALQTVFVDGVFDPSFRVGGSNAPDLQISGNVKDDLVPTVASDLNQDVQKTY